MDEVADIICTVLQATEAAQASGGTSKAKYLLAATDADMGRKRAGELLRRFPLYPEIQL